MIRLSVEVLELSVSKLVCVFLHVLQPYTIAVKITVFIYHW